MNTESPLISVVITTKNEEKNIENCLLSVQEQTYQNIETIVVDNNSSDKTKELSKKYTKNVYDKGPERSAQRNFGALDRSNGEYVMFVDADMMLGPHLIEDCFYNIKNGSDIALHIPEIILGYSYFSKVRRLERGFYDGTVIDGARFFNKDKLREVGGFDENMSGPEDWDIDKKIKQIGSIGLIRITSRNMNNWKLHDYVFKRGVNANEFPNGIFHNEADFNLIEYLKKKSYYAKSFDAYIQKWGKLDLDIRKQIGIYYGVFLEHGKWKRIVSHPLLSIGMYMLRFLVSLVYLKNTMTHKNE